jgi:hypothetical protein
MLRISLLVELHYISPPLLGRGLYACGIAIPIHRLHMCINSRIPVSMYFLGPSVNSCSDDNYGETELILTEFRNSARSFYLSFVVLNLQVFALHERAIPKCNRLIETACLSAIINIILVQIT